MRITSAALLGKRSTEVTTAHVDLAPCAADLLAAQRAIGVRHVAGAGRRRPQWARRIAALKSGARARPYEVQNVGTLFTAHHVQSLARQSNAFVQGLGSLAHEASEASALMRSWTRTTHTAVLTGIFGGMIADGGDVAARLNDE
jgi:hypothetical protein